MVLSDATMYGYVCGSETPHCPPKQSGHFKSGRTVFPDGRYRWPIRLSPGGWGVRSIDWMFEWLKTQANTSINPKQTHCLN